MQIGLENMNKINMYQAVLFCIFFGLPSVLAFMLGWWLGGVIWT